MTTNPERDAPASEQLASRLARSVDAAGLGTFYWRAADDVTWWDAAQERLFGRPHDPTPGRGVTCYLDCIHPDDRERATRQANSAAAASGAYRVEYRIVRPDGAVAWILEHGYAERDAAGRIVAIGGACLDISERKRMEESLHDSLARYEALATTSPDAIFVNRAGRVAEVNPACLRLFGAERAEELIGRRVFELFHPDCHPLIRERIAAMLADGSPAPLLEERIVRLDGRAVDVEVVSAPFADRGGQAIYVVLRDVTERKHSEEALRHREQLLREAGEMAHVGGWEFDPATGAGSWTAETARIHDLDPGEPTDVSRGLEFFRGESRRQIEAAVRAAVERGEPYDLELELVSARGVVKWVRTIGRPELRDGRVVRVRGAIQDVTARVVLESELRQSQKLEAIGRLAGGIAHDFNNLLTIIAGAGELLEHRLPAAGDHRPLLLEIRDAAERAATLTRQLLAFGRSQVLSPQVIELNAAVARGEAMLRRLIGEDVELVSRLAPDAGHVRVDPGQLDQVILNLAVNARDAMPRGGRLTLETAALEIDAESGTPGVAPGPYVELAVADDGIGMPPAVLARAFEPFFTTKEAGKGSGLGLSTVFGIVKQSGGHIDVRSEVGHGTRFVILLPRVAAEPTASPHRPAPRGARGHEIVLLVEDEPSLRKLVVVALEGQGYRVLSAADGREALDLASRHDGPIDLLATDMVMPGMSGRELAARLAERRPGLRVVFMSGYAHDAVERGGIRAEEGAYLAKPFSLQQLAQTVRSVLDAPAPS